MFIIALAASLIDKVTTGHTMGLFYTIVALATFLPSLSVDVRRLHDIGKSGWCWWIVLIPLVGIIILIVWFCQKGTVGINRFGPDPLGSKMAG